MLYDDFKQIVDIVLNNWTALQLAVEHGMGAPGGEKTAQMMSAYIAQYCTENVVDIYELTETLDDIMDEEFETVCHDNSSKEVARLLLMFLGLLKEGRIEELTQRINAMPKCQKWLSQPLQNSAAPQGHGNPDDDTTSSSGDDDDEADETAAVSRTPEPAEAMEEDVDPGWTVVRTRRKK